jgi:hypothetical protein
MKGEVGSMDCQHMEFNSYFTINRLVDDEGLLTGFHASVRVQCRACNLSFVFLGLPMGMSFDGATVSIDGEELRVAIAPSFEWAGPGKDSTVRGFSANFVRHNEKGGDQ